MSEISATSTSTSRISEILRQHDQGILSEWTKHQLSESGLRPGLEEVIARQQQELLELSQARRKAPGGRPGIASDRHSGQLAHSGCHGKPARADREYECFTRHHD